MSNFSLKILATSPLINSSPLRPYRIDPPPITNGCSPSCQAHSQWNAHLHYSLQRMLPCAQHSSVFPLECFLLIFVLLLLLPAFAAHVSLYPHLPSSSPPPSWRAICRSFYESSNAAFDTPPNS
eukprot:482416_1